MSTAVSPSARAPRCPFAHGMPYDPLSVAATENSEPWLSAARDQAPVFYLDEQDVYVVTRHADILSVLRDPATFSSRYANKFRPLESPVLRAAFPDGHPGLRSMLLADPPAHNRIRRLANVALTPKAVANAEPDMRRRCHQLLDRIQNRGQADLMADFGAPMTIMMISDLAGLPESVHEDLRHWSGDYFALTYGAPPPTEEREREIADRAVRMSTFLHGFVEERRHHPRGDLVSALLHARTAEGDPMLTTDEVIGVLNSLTVAGVETTALFVPMLVRLLLRHPEQLAEVRADPSLLPTAIEEGLRHTTVARGVRRTATRDTEITGVPIPAGQDVFLSYVSANHDPAVFPDAERFDVRRSRADRHLTLGKGSHYCIGAPLAKAQARIALEVLLERLPGLRLIDDELSWKPHMTLPRPDRLRVAWEPR
ncbi:MAG TPA: cytochrome P450 [Pseudonocardia sp.]